jgi:hypothetical protein
MSLFEQGHALIIGACADLPATVDDAIGLASILTDDARCAYPPGQVRLLTGEKATRAQIIDALDDLAATAGDDSTVIVYFSGHGYRVQSTVGEFYYLMPNGYDLSRLAATAIRGDDFTGRLRAIPARKLLLLLDCCHAGGVGDAKAAGVTLAKAPLPAETLELLAEGSGRVLIASSRENELSFDGRPYSAFTLALIEALCGEGVAKRDGFVTVSDLALHTRQMVPGRTGHQQHPVLHWERADNFVVATYAGGETTPKGLPFAGEPAIEPAAGAWRAAAPAQTTVHGDQIISNGPVATRGSAINTGERGIASVGDGNINIT